MPADLAQALAEGRTAGAFFAKLSNSLRRHHVDNINAAKAEDIRRRIDNAVPLSRQGKQIPSHPA